MTAELIPDDAEAILRERPSLVLPDPSELFGLVDYDLETSGLAVDDEARVCAVGVAYRLKADRDAIYSHGFAFDQGRAEDKGFTVQYHLDTPTNRKQGVVGLPKGDPHGRWDWDTDYNLPREEWDALCAWLKDAGRAVGLTNQNIKFDDLMMRAGTRHWPGVELEQYIRWDTMLASPRIWPRLGTNALKPIGAIFWGEDAVAEAQVVKEALIEVQKRYGLKATVHGKRYDLLPWPGVNGPYVAQDAVLALQLTELQHRALEDGYAPVQHITRAVDVCRVLTRMERRGFGPYDVQASAAVADRIDAKIEQLKATLPFDPPTGPRAATYFFDELGMAPWNEIEQHRLIETVPDERKNAAPGAMQRKVTFQGDLSTPVARRMAQAGVPHADAWAQITELSIANKMFYRNYADLAGPDGRLRTNYRQAHVRSGRLSVERWQAQALPKKVDIRLDGEPLSQPRSFFGVRPGYRRMNLDLGQAELRIASHLAGCEVMSTAVASGADFHSQTTKRVYAVDETHPDWGVWRDMGKRLPISNDTPVPTPDGWTTAGEVKTGDFIFGSDGQPVRVSAVYPQGVIPVYEVELSDGRIVKAGANHLWYVLHTTHRHYQRADSERPFGPHSRASRVMTTEELIEELADKARGCRDGYLVLPLPSAAEHSEKTLAIDPYLLGAWLGNGSRTRGGNGIYLAVHSDDVPHWAAEFGPARHVRQSAKNGHVMVWFFDGIHNNDLRAAWSDIDRYSVGSVAQRLALLQGLMDTDGTARRGRKTTGNPAFYNTDQAKAELVVRLVRSLGGFATLRKYHSPSRGDSRKPLFHVTVQLRQHNPFRLKRKADQWRLAQKQGVRIVDIRRHAIDQPAVCWTVDAPDSLFLAGEYVVTHNTFASIFQIGGPKYQKTLWEEAGLYLPLRECYSAVHAWRATYPEFGAAFYQWMEFAEKNEYVPLIDGSPSWLTGPRDYPSSAWNRVVQSSLALFANDWIVAVERVTAKYDALVGVVHDSCILDLPEDVADDLCAQLAMMTEQMWFDWFGIVGKCDVGPWAK